MANPFKFSKEEHFPITPALILAYLALAGLLFLCGMAWFGKV